MGCHQGGICRCWKTSINTENFTETRNLRAAQATCTCTLTCTCTCSCTYMLYMDMCMCMCMYAPAVARVCCPKPQRSPKRRLGLHARMLNVPRDMTHVGSMVASMVGSGRVGVGE